MQWGRLRGLLGTQSATRAHTYITITIYYYMCGDIPLIFSVILYPGNTEPPPKLNPNINFSNQKVKFVGWKQDVSFLGPAKYRQFYRDASIPIFEDTRTRTHPTPHTPTSLRPGLSFLPVGWSQETTVLNSSEKSK